MPSWNRILVGDAFKLQPAGIDYYRDLFLLWPFLGFSMAATSFLLQPKSVADRVTGLTWAACAAVVLLFAKEKRILAMAAPTYVFAHMAFAVIFIHTTEILLWTSVSGIATLAIFRSRWIREWKAQLRVSIEILRFGYDRRCFRFRYNAFRRTLDSTLKAVFLRALRASVAYLPAPAARAFSFGATSLANFSTSSAILSRT